MQALIAAAEAAGFWKLVSRVFPENIASLRLLSQFQFHVVKIDLSLVQRAGDDRTHSVLRSIVEMAQRRSCAS